jgi:hypothetical protein
MQWLLELALFVTALAGLAPDTRETEQQAKHGAAREQQWVYRDTLGSGQVEPTAVFLSWDYSSVVFSATCDAKTRELVVRSALETGPDAPSVEPLEISSSSSTIRLHTTVRDGYFEGRTQVTEKLAKILRSESDLEVFVPTEMGEPIYVGRAEPLRRLGLACGRNPHLQTEPSRE